VALVAPAIRAAAHFTFEASFETDRRRCYLIPVNNTMRRTRYFLAEWTGHVDL
jgi:hypothetical protein